MIRRRGWPTTIETFRTKRDAQDWARRIEDEMVRGVHIDRAGSGRLLLRHALDCYLREVSSTKRATTSYAEGHKSMQMLKRYTHLRAENLVAQLDHVIG